MLVLSNSVRNLSHEDIWAILIIQLLKYTINFIILILDGHNSYLWLHAYKCHKFLHMKGAV